MKIAEVSKLFDVPAETLRYYERAGLLLPVNRTENGIRDFDERDLHRVEFILRMRNAGLSIEVLKEYMRLVEAGDETITQRKDILIKEKEKLEQRIEEFQFTMNMLKYKICVYEKAVLLKEKELSEIDLE
jgi:DNA-binding transcriptional MerR regulator